MAGGNWHHPGDRRVITFTEVPHPRCEMVEFLPCVFSSRRPHSVGPMKVHLGNASGKTRWLVGTGERAQYMKAGALNVMEIGDLCNVMAFGIDLANTKKTPDVLNSDDIRDFFAFVGSPAKWTSPWHGCKLGLSDFATRVLAAMRQVAAPLGGVACTANAAVQLQAPEMSYHHFFTMDFMVFDPPINFPVAFHSDAQHKLDYHIIASALAAVGAVCRLNRFSIDARHHNAGGAGSGDARRGSDFRACRWLQRRWGADAICLYAQRAAQVVLRGRQLVQRACVRLPALHQDLYAATVPTKCPGMNFKAIGAGARRAKAKAKAGAGRGKANATLAFGSGARRAKANAKAGAGWGRPRRRPVPDGGRPRRRRQWVEGAACGGSAR